MTLTSGAIMGGVGAVISGGNFWQGAATGLMVSGLNDLAHSGLTNRPNQRLIKKLNREISKAFGNRADDEYNPMRFNSGGATDADVETAWNLDTVKTIRSNSGNPVVKIMHESNKADAIYKSAGEDLYGGDTLEAAQSGQKGTIRLYSGAFSSPRHLVHVMIHELSHSYSRYYGQFLTAYKGFGWNKAVAFDEIYAWTWGSVYGQTMFISPGVYQKGVGDALTTLGIKY